MQIAVIQHRVRPVVTEDRETLARSAKQACADGASAVVCPATYSLSGEGALGEFVRAVTPGCAADAIVPFAWPSSATSSAPVGQTALGATALLNGDDALDPVRIAALQDAPPDAIVMRPAAESSLQAEAFIEWAIALSSSVAPLVIVAEIIGEGGGQTGFGGTCVVLLEDVVAEAERDDDSEVLAVELDAPVPMPEPREPLGRRPGILVQRFEHHHGRRAPVDYPAELS